MPIRTTNVSLSRENLELARQRLQNGLCSTLPMCRVVAILPFRKSRTWYLLQTLFWNPSEMQRPCGTIIHHVLANICNYNSMLRGNQLVLILPTIYWRSQELLDRSR